MYFDEIASMRRDMVKGMETFQLTDIRIKIGDKNVANAPAGVLDIDSMIKVTIADIILNSENMSLLALITSERGKEFQITGIANGRLCTLVKALLSNIRFYSDREEGTHLKDIIFYAPALEWGKRV